MSNKVVITADSTCDLSEELIKQHHIHIVPLIVVLEGETLHDGVDVNPQMIFDSVAATGQLPSTAAPSPAEYEEHFAPILAEGAQIVHISISEKFSSAYANACVAAQTVGNTFVVDSRNLSTGSGHLVLLAAEMAAEGLDAQQIKTRLEEIALRVDASFILDTLDFLHKGGRCSSVARLGANLLKLKPCIEVKDGAMSVGKKYRGNYEACLVSYVKDRLASLEDIEQNRIFITCTNCTPQMISLVRETIESMGKFAEIIHTTAGCTVTTHCGHNCLGILYIRKSPK